MTSWEKMDALRALPETSSYSSSDMTSIASGSSRNVTRLGMRRIVVPSRVALNVVLLMGPYWLVKASCSRFSSRLVACRWNASSKPVWRADVRCSEAAKNCEESS